MRGEVPEGWRRAHIGEVMSEHQERCGDQQLAALSLTKSRGVVKASERFGRALYGKDVSRYRHVRRGEVVLDPMLLWDGAISRLWRFAEGFVSPDYRVYRPNRQIHHGFLDHLLCGHEMRSAYRNNARGTNKRRNRIARSDFLAIEFLSPPLPEQRKIAAILSSVDEAIAATEAVIAQTRRVKEGLLQDLLTRGIGRGGRPHTRFKQTEIGEIPESWEVVSLGTVLSGIVPGRSPSATDEPASGDQWGVLKVSAVGQGIFKENENKVLPEGFEIAVHHRVQPGDVLITRANTAALVGACCRVPTGAYNLMLCDKTLRLEPVQGRITHDYLKEVVCAPTSRRFFAGAATGSSASMKNISQSEIRALRFGLPPQHEQRGITERLDAMHAELAVCTAQVESLRQTKAGLLQDLLTGKVRVSV